MSDFYKGYREQETVKNRINFIKENYPLLARVCVTGDQVRSILGRNHIGECSKTSDGYHVKVEGDDEMRGYLTLHEMLHVWLEERGLTADVAHENEDVRAFLFMVRNLLNDFLIESEIQRQCGSVYGNDLLYTHSKQIAGHFSGYGTAEGSHVFINGLLSTALAGIYSSSIDIKKSNLRGIDVFHSGTIKLPNQDEILSLFEDLRPEEITPEEYQEVLSKLVKLLVDVDVSFEAENVNIDDPKEIADFVKEMNEHFEKLKGLLQTAFSQAG